MENDLKNLPYYSDYVMESNSLNELLKNDKSIKERKGFWCQPYNLNGDRESSYARLEAISQELSFMNISINPAANLGGGIFFKIIDTEKFYDFICEKIETLVNRIILQLSSEQRNDLLNIIRTIYTRIDVDFLTLEKWLRSNKTDDFEIAICHLFSLIGYTAIHVGNQFEKSTLRDRRERYGKSSTSIDVLAFYDDKVIICQCSTDFNSKKINEVSNISHELFESINSNGSVCIIPVIASTVSKSSVKATIDEANNQGVKVLIKEGIEEVLTKIRTGEFNHPLKLLDYLL